MKTKQEKNLIRQTLMTIDDLIQLQDKTMHVRKFASLFCQYFLKEGPFLHEINYEL